MFPLIDDKGLSAAVYTQTTDVEIEVNGLLTYDRELIKVPLDQIAKVNRGDVPPRPRINEVVASALTERPSWRFTTDKPEDTWFQPGFDAASWKEGVAGFGTRGTPGATVRTEWSTPNIWLRREFSLPDVNPNELKFLVHHDEDAAIYINGVLAAVLPGHTSDYELVPIRPKALAALKRSGNMVAVNCRQTAGGQYFDLAIVTSRMPNK